MCIVPLPQIINLKIWFKSNQSNLVASNLILLIRIQAQSPSLLEVPEGQADPAVPWL